jgi:hypothetical protein
MRTDNIKAILQYTDYSHEGKTFYKILMEHRVKVIKSIRNILLNRQNVTVMVDTYEDLQDVLYQLNNKCCYEVRLVKCKENTK